MMLIKSLTPLETFTANTNNTILKKSTSNCKDNNRNYYNTDISKNPRTSKFDSNGSSLNSDIAFLQRQQEELLKDLHQEIHTLKTENSELKFQLYAILRTSLSRDCKNKIDCSDAIGILNINNDGNTVFGLSTSSSEEKYKNVNQDNDGLNFNIALDAELYKSTSTALSNSNDHDDANKVQSEFAEKVYSTGLENNSNKSHQKKNDLILLTRRQSSIVSELECKTIPTSLDVEKCFLNTELSIPSKAKNIAKSTVTQTQSMNDEKHIKKTQWHPSRASIPNITNLDRYDLKLFTPSLQNHTTHRSLSASSKHIMSKRRSSLSILPSNYKEAVATLPPINLTPRQDTFSMDVKHKTLKNKSWSIVEQSSLNSKSKSSLNSKSSLLTKLASSKYQTRLDREGQCYKKRETGDTPETPLSTSQPYIDYKDKKNKRLFE